ncbi:MAG: hypothetical protein UY63_C0017G0083 [Parcubacteria group bacterium GW2011_GWA2_51_10]|nr:MAG: hypothetical protein UY63_C0017G0083 [Parcubacteria group bacterium GW2011_GWA2_51_10]
MEFLAHNAEEMGQFASEFAQKLAPRKDGAVVVALSGELGAGKTTFVQGVARAMGIKDTVPSPTFIIERIYKTESGPFSRLIHIDAYRLASDLELLHLGWKELLADPESLILLEWPENVGALIPPYAVRLSFETLAGEERKITYHEAK